MERQTLLHELRALIARECECAVDPTTLDDDAPLIGRNSPLGLDSLDALQLSVAVQKRYDKPIQGSRQARAALRSLNVLADFILTP